MTFPPLKITASGDLAGWLSRENISIAFTTYQTNRLFFIGTIDGVNISAHERLFDKPMGLHATGEELYLSTRYQIWNFRNHLRSGEKYNYADRLYVPRSAYFTGDLNVHDVALDDARQVIFVNTDFSCLATLNPDYSFVPLWRPPFISELVAEDRCHLNGLAIVDGTPGYVTACSTTDRAAGWREHRLNGGVAIDVRANEIVAGGLSMPHSPRWYGGKLWLLNSGTGELGYIGGGKFEPTVFCPGFVRGLAFWKDTAIVGLSKLRTRSFTGLVLEERLNRDNRTPQCGLMVISLSTGEIKHWLHLDGIVEELFDTVVLPGTRLVKALGLQGDDLQRLVTFPGSGGIVMTKPTVKRPGIGSPVPIAGLPGEVGVKYQSVYNLAPENLLTYDELTFPRLSQRWLKSPQRGELIGISASIAGIIIGLAIAEILDDRTAELISLLVLPEYRGRGIGTGLILHLERESTGKGCTVIRLTYEKTSLTTLALEPLLNELQWQIGRIDNKLSTAYKSLA